MQLPELCFNGDFAYGAPLPHVPNPCLYIEGFGALGLPLNEREAKHVLNHFTHAAESDSNAICSIDASQVSFQNPAWQSALTEIAKNVCTLLGAVFPLDGPACEFQTLSLCVPGTWSVTLESG